MALEVDYTADTALAMLRLRRRRRALQKQRQFREADYFHQPGRFIRECFEWPDGQSAFPYQCKAAETLEREHRLAIRGPRGATKTAIAAMVFLWFAITREAAGIDWQIGTTAGSNRQLIQFLWPEIKKWSKRLRWDIIGRAPFTKDELTTKQLTLEHGHAWGGASKDANLMEGLHASEVLMIFDEAKAIARAIFEACEGAFQTGNAYVLALSTPGDPTGFFYDIHARRRELRHWFAMHITLRDVMAVGQIKLKEVKQRLGTWGRASRLFQGQVLGEFVTNDPHALIPLAWIEAANERWEDWRESGDVLGLMNALGSDVAVGGRDSALIAPRHGNLIPEILIASSDPMQLTGQIVAMIKANPGATAIVDTQTVGAGVGSRLKELDMNYIGFNGGRSTKFRDLHEQFEFADTRSAAYWNVRDLLDPANGFDLALPVFEPDRTLSLAGDLAAPRWWYTSGGKIKVESKNSGSEEMGGGLRKRLHRSTDAGDSVVLAFWPGEPDAPPDEWFAGVGDEMVSGQA